ncbi:STAS domain-containing protein [Chitiniphilus shinanonensis]|uniref:STAS domain-containing protein n=1 Tax=Chitiniphilus shinanonensis TaxID=553088 RepID=UPI00305E28D5
MKIQNEALAQYLRDHEAQALSAWLDELQHAARPAAGRAIEKEAQQLIRALQAGLAQDADNQIAAPQWQALRQQLEALSASRAASGESAGETSRFVLALKKPLFLALQQQFSDRPQALTDALWWTSVLVDGLAQLTVSTYQLTREDIIRRQQDELLELSTPVVKLWDGLLAVPMIGTLDSSRTQMVMEALLQQIAETGASLAIIDITGVPTVDTLVAQHLLKTVTAIRLMGADCIISGIRPQIAQTIVHLGIDLQGITTKATLADALAVALRQGGYVVTRKV